MTQRVQVGNWTKAEFSSAEMVFCLVDMIKEFAGSNHLDIGHNLGKDSPGGIIISTFGWNSLDRIMPFVVYAAGRMGG